MVVNSIFFSLHLLLLRTSFCYYPREASFEWINREKNLIYIQIFCTRCRFPSLRRCRRRCSYRIHFVNIVLLGNINIPLSVFLLLSHFLQGCHQLAFLKYTVKLNSFWLLSFLIIEWHSIFNYEWQQTDCLYVAKMIQMYFFNYCAFYQLEIHLWFQGCGSVGKGKLGNL